jgi:two-component system OmpR family response regulator
MLAKSKKLASGSNAPQCPEYTLFGRFLLKLSGLTKGSAKTEHHMSKRRAFEIMSSTDGRPFYGLLKRRSCREAVKADAMTLRVLLIEDDSMLAKGIAAALTQSGYDVEVAPTAEIALRLSRTAAFNIGILDLGLPDRDGLELLREMRSAAQFPVLILSARDGLNDRICGLDSGADDYLVKPFALGELEARMRALLRRGDENPEWRQVGRLRFDVEGKRALVGDEEVDLTAREVSILNILLSRSRKVVRKQVLFDAVFPHETEAAPNALEVHVSRLRHKLKPAGVTIRSLRGLGYRIEEVLENGTSQP